ncbi:hypothetical protein [Variovorax sp. RCC_210]|uniref:hypothetical protein n=1 Tax=Variovorax sp. RCC_210 TaxID=3239217 RepID=UPI003525D165
MPDPLKRLQGQTEALVAQRLRSASVVIARLCDAIGHAHALGHSHAAIHAHLRAGGLAVSWNNYRAALVRARRRTPPGATGEPTPAPAEAPVRPARADDTAAAAPASASAPVQLLDAFAAAQRAAARDYAQVARASGRKARTSP